MDKYERVAKLGEGGQGKVYKVRSKTTGRELVCKMILCVDQETVELATKEAEVMGWLKHPNIIQYEGTFLHQGKAGLYLCLIMEYCPRGDLHTKMREYKHSKETFKEKQAVRYLRQVLTALEFMHKSGFCHRDIKAANILFDARGAVKVGDFGLSTLMSPMGQQTVVGTPFYFAPEIMLQRKYTTKVDIWNLGVVMLELCTLRQRPVNVEVLHDESRVLDDVYREVTRNGFSRALATLLTAMLRRRPQDRPAASDLITQVAATWGEADDAPSSGPRAAHADPVAAAHQVPPVRQPTPPQQRPSPQVRQATPQQQRPAGGGGTPLRHATPPLQRPAPGTPATPLGSEAPARHATPTRRVIAATPPRRRADSECGDSPATPAAIAYTPPVHAHHQRPLPQQVVARASPRAAPQHAAAATHTFQQLQQDAGGRDAGTQATALATPPIPAAAVAVYHSPSPQAADSGLPPAVPDQQARDGLRSPATPAASGPGPPTPTAAGRAAWPAAAPAHAPAAAAAPQGMQQVLSGGSRLSAQRDGPAQDGAGGSAAGRQQSALNLSNNSQDSNGLSSTPGSTSDRPSAQRLAARQSDEVYRAPQQPQHHHHLPSPQQHQQPQVQHQQPQMQHQQPQQGLQHQRAAPAPAAASVGQALPSPRAAPAPAAAASAGRPATPSRAARPPAAPVPFRTARSPSPQRPHDMLQHGSPRHAMPQSPRGYAQHADDAAFQNIVQKLLTLQFGDVRTKARLLACHSRPEVITLCQSVHDDGLLAQSLEQWLTLKVIDSGPGR